VPHPESRPPRGWAALSLERKLPLLIGGFLLATSLALAVAGYAALRRNAVLAGEARSGVLAAQLRDYLSNTLNPMRAATAGVAARPEISAFVRRPDIRIRDSVLTLFRASRNTNLVGITVRSRDGSASLTSVPDSLAGTYAAFEREMWDVERPVSDSARIHRLRVVGDALRFATTAPVPGHPDALVIVWWRLNTSEQTRTTFTNLIGSKTAVFIGNTVDSGWTNLERLVDRPADLTEALTEARLHRHGGEDFLIRAEAIPRSPWSVAIEMPLHEITAPANQFARQVAAILVLVVAVGLLLAWRVSRDITRPLVELTGAATSISRGDYGVVPHIVRADEIGRLRDAFATMSSEVEQARTKLEAKVDERTRELNTAVKDLNDAQDALVRREKMATLGQLASGVGHELRNPLGVMTNAVYYLRAVLAAQPDNVREYLDILHQQIALSEKIVADLLDFARSKPPHRTPTDLRRIVQGQVAQLAAAGNTGVAVTEDFAAGLPPVLVDGSQVGQIVLNLLTNAAQAMDGQGTIAIRALGDVDRVHLEVMDTGPGVSPEHLEKIFEPLFTTKARGIGLGLALSRTLARANGGDLAARNNAGRGATFTLTLPAAPAAAPAESAPGETT
jgi:signal transduction histidine kinase